MPDRIVGKMFDGHTITGIGGLFASVALTDVSAIASIAVGTATAAYMALRAAREWIKIRADIRAENIRPKNKPPTP